MSKVAEFYQKAMADPAAKAELAAILNGKDIAAATEEDLAKIGEVAKKLGYEITVEEAKEYLNPAEAELSDDDLDAVAGGKGDPGVSIGCTTGGGQLGGDVSCEMAAGTVGVGVGVNS